MPDSLRLSQGKQLLGLGGGRDLLRGFPCLFEDRLRLLADTLDGMPHRGLRRARHLELGDDTVDTANVRLDGIAVVTAHGNGKGDVADIRWDACPIRGFLRRCRFGRRRAPVIGSGSA